MIDHSLLHPAITDADISKGCELAINPDEKYFAMIKAATGFNYDN